MLESARQTRNLLALAAHFVSAAFTYSLASRTIAVSTTAEATDLFFKFAAIAATLTAVTTLVITIGAQGGGRGAAAVRRACVALLGALLGGLAVCIAMPYSPWWAPLAAAVTTVLSVGLAKAMTLRPTAFVAAASAGLGLAAGGYLGALMAVSHLEDVTAKNDALRSSQEDVASDLAVASDRTT